MLGWRWQFSGDFEAQQRFGGILACRCAQRLDPAAAHRRRDLLAQFLRSRKLFRITLFPSGQQVGQHFAVGLHGKLFQRLVGRFKGFALCAERGIAQTRAALFKRWTVAETLGTFRTLCAFWTVRLELVVGARTRAAGLAARTRVLAVAKLATPPGSAGGFGLAHAGAVIAAHGDDGLGSRLRCGRRLGRLTRWLGRFSKLGRCGFGGRIAIHIDRSRRCFARRICYVFSS